MLRGVDLTVVEGQLVCLIGSSGSGKSTLLRTVNLLTPIDDGAIFLDGRDISLPDQDPRPIREQIGMVFQSYNLFPHMTALDNVLLAPRRVFREPDSSLLPRVHELFDRFRSWQPHASLARPAFRAASSSASPLSARWR